MESIKKTLKSRKLRLKKKDNDFDVYLNKEDYREDENYGWDKKRNRKKSGKRFHTKQTHKEDFLKESLS